MVFEKYSNLEGTHAFLSPSNNAWTNYTEEKLAERWERSQAVIRGTRLHEWAKDAIELNRPMPKNKDTVNMYINDAIKFAMQPEQPLFYSYNCYGTADAISYHKNILRIHDLKTGEVVEAHMKQLMIYAALFCLNYQAIVAMHRKKGMRDIDIAEMLELSPAELHFDPTKFDDIVLRIYQFNEIREEHPDPAEIQELMDIIIVNDAIIQKLKTEG